MARNGEHKYTPAVDAAKTFLEMQTLASRWVIQLLASLAKSGVNISVADRTKLVSPIVTGISALLTVAATGYNVFKAKESERVLPPAAEEFIMSALGSSLLYILYDFVSSGDSLDANLPEFIMTSIAVPVVMAFLAHTNISDKAFEHAGKINFDDLKARLEQEGTSVAENINNAVEAGFKYGLSGLLACWALKREVTGQTEEGIPYYQVGIAATIATLAAVSGYMARRRPMVIARVASMLGSLTTFSLSYSAMSGLMSMLLAAVNEDSDEDATPALKAAYVTICLIPAAIAAYHKSQTTQVRLDEWHKAYESMVHKLAATGRGLSYVLRGQAFVDVAAWCRRKPADGGEEQLPLVGQSAPIGRYSTFRDPGSTPVDNSDDATIDVDGDKETFVLASQFPVGTP